MKRFNNKRIAFTLAEIMVVLFVMTIILAAFAPMMSTRTKVNKTSPWTYASPDSANAYFGAASNQRVMIGQKTKGTDIDNKLTINTSGTTQSHILLKESGTAKSVISSPGTNNYLWRGAPYSTGTYTGVVAVGTNALSSATGTVNYSTALGYQACNGLSSASYTTCIGAYSGKSSGTSNTVYLGNASSTIYVFGTSNLKTLVSSSDARLKNIQGENNEGLEKIKKLKVFNYTYKDDKKATPRVGVIAQDLKKIFPKAVSKGEDGFLNIRQEDMFYAMVNAIKELANRDDAKDRKIKALEKKNTELEARLLKIEKQLTK